MFFFTMKWQNKLEFSQLIGFINIKVRQYTGLKAINHKDCLIWTQKLESDK